MWFNSDMIIILMRKIIQEKRKGFRSAIRREWLDQFFARKRKELLETKWEGAEMSSKEEMFLASFPSGIEDMCKYDLSPVLLQKMVQQPHFWLENCKPLLNISQWMGLIELLLKMMERIEPQEERLSMLQSSRSLICSNMARLQSQNKTMKKQILMQLLDLFLQTRAQLTLLHQDYITLLSHTLKDVLSLKLEDNQLLLIKAFSLCNMLMIDGTMREKKVINELLVKQKWNTSRMIAFIQDHGLVLKDRQANGLIKIVLITLINLIEFDCKNSFYQLFWQTKFKAFIQQTLHFPSDFDQSFLPLYLKLFYNLMITNEIFAHFINSIIDTNSLHLKLQEQESVALLKEIQELIAQIC